MAIQITKTKDRVFKYLTHYPETRDSDNVLLSKMLSREAKDKGITQLNDFLYSLSRGEFTNPESIRRVRQKLQETNPDLRGTTYKHRKEVEEPRILDEVLNFNPIKQIDEIIGGLHA